MQAQNPMREDMKLREDMKQEMMVCVPQCVVITSTLTAVIFLMNAWTMTQIHFITLITLVMYCDGCTMTTVYTGTL